MDYPVEVNGWHFSSDKESMSYWKEIKPGTYDAVSLCWEVTNDDGYYIPEDDTYVLLLARGNSSDEALEGLYTSNWAFGDVMKRSEAEKALIKYMKSH